MQAIRTYQSSREAQRAADLSAADSREMVVYVVTAGYLQVIAESARVDSAKVQVTAPRPSTSRPRIDSHAGLSAKIDMTRSQVELQTQQQRLTAEAGRLSRRDKIALARLDRIVFRADYTLTDKIALRAA